MATAAPAAPPRTSRSFAGLLEEYAAPPQKFPPARDPVPPRTGLRPGGEDLDGLDDDVVALSYERALKTHARYRREPEPAPQASPATEVNTLAQPIAREEPQALPRTLAQAQPAMPIRKSASVTVRLTAQEDDQMRARAAEAGLTNSAYLRSCAFEVESLRAQVKEAVARMREAELRLPAARRRIWIPGFLRRAHNRA